MAVSSPDRIKPGPVAMFFGTTNFVGEFAKMKLEPGDQQAATFGELMNGTGAKFKLTGTVGMSTAAASFHTFQRTNVGKELAVVFAPHGNKTASADQPHIKTTVRIPTPPPIAQEIDATDGQFYDFEFPCTVEPTYHTTGSLPS